MLKDDNRRVNPNKWTPYRRPTFITSFDTTTREEGSRDKSLQGHQGTLTGATLTNVVPLTVYDVWSRTE